MFTVIVAPAAVILVTCWLSTALPTPGRSMVVFGAGVPWIGSPATTAPASCEPVALT